MAESRAKLSALVRGIMSAVQSASDIAGQQHLDLLTNFFHCADDGSVVPRVVRIALPQGQSMDVPLICLVNPSSYYLSEMSVELAIKLSPGELKAAVEKGVETAGGSRQSYHVEMTNKEAKDAVKVSMKFEAEDTEPEALTRLLESLTNGYAVPTRSPDSRLPLWSPAQGVGPLGPLPPATPAGPVGPLPPATPGGPGGMGPLAGLAPTPSDQGTEGPTGPSAPQA
jgi:hypothetical protein